jgi:hypothetical protein
MRALNTYMATVQPDQHIGFQAALCSAPAGARGRRAQLEVVAIVDAQPLPSRRVDQ